MELTTSAEERAHRLLERMRETPMRRGALSLRAQQLKREIARAIMSQGVSSGLARRVALQLAFKFRRRDLQDEAEWRAVGQILRKEVARLRDRVGLSNQRIVAVLPKLSANQVADFLDELTKADRTIARTILHAAVNTSDPLVAGRRYLAEYRLVARKLRDIDPTMARTVAAATFSAGAPLSKAMEYLKRFASLMATYRDQPRMARRLARAGFRARPTAEGAAGLGHKR
jgi:uncharacterized protein YoaH (UPF0181 family)